MALHVWLDILLYVSFQRCSPVEETSALSVLHGDLWITAAIDDSDSIPMGLCTVCHEAFEVGILDAVLCHEIVQFSPHDTLDLGVLRLHVTYGDGHDLAIHCIVHVTRHCGPLFNTLDMVKHEQAFSRSPPGCMRLTRSTPLQGPSSNILKTYTFSLP
jgi:hypothetical protein